MDTVFQEYSTYYDLLNTGKEYGREADYVIALARRHAPARPLATILNLGCGTGCHDLHLARQGFQVTGVDCAETMLAIAQAAAAKEAFPHRPDFLAGDITRLQLGRQFDLALALFHVMSYQTATEALRQAIHSAADHLVPGGLFIFDFWYGPAVLHEKPAVRIRRVENEELALMRIAEPVLRENTNTVEVHFDVQITKRATGERQNLRETHLMRYLFLPEVQDLLQQGGLTFLTAEETLTGQAPSLSTWNVTTVARKEA